MARTIQFVLLLLAAMLCSTATAQTDSDILNLALNLECLEAEFYSWAAYGAGTRNSTSVGGTKAQLSTPVQELAEELAVDEFAHLDLLRAYISGLGNAPVECPLMDLRAFATAANLALNDTLTPPFSPYTDDIAFYLGAFMFEDLGVKAYHQASTTLASKQLAGVAAGLLGTEAYHAGIIRTALAFNSANVTSPYGIAVTDFVQAIADLTSSQGLLTDAGTLNLVPADENSVVYFSDPSEVLSILYLGGSSDGGFLPDGTTGAISQVQPTSTAA